MPVHEDTQPIVPLTAQEERGGCGCGCWIPAILTLLLVVALVGVGLFLPPINLYDRWFGPQYDILSAERNAVRADGLTLVVAPDDVGQDFGAALNSVSLSAVNSGDPAAETVSAALETAPPYLALQSAVFSVETTGRSPNEVTLSINVPPNAGDTDLLDVYGWNETAAAWKFIPAQFDGAGLLTATVSKIPSELALFQSAPQPEPTVLASIGVTQSLTSNVAELATVVAPGGLQPTLEGTLTGSLAAGFELNAGYEVLPVIRNFADPRALDPDTVTAILSSSVARTDHITQITAFAGSGYNGVMIDYRGLTLDQRDQFSAFITELGSELDKLGLALGVVLPAAENVEGRWETGAYDWRALGLAADYVQINLTIDPSTFAPGPDRLVEAMMRWGVGEISRHKILLTLSPRSVQQIGGEYSPVSYAEALSALGDVKIEADLSEADTVEPGSEVRARLDGFEAELGVEEAIKTTYIDYFNDDSLVARMWLTTPDALAFRMERTLPFALGGVAFDDLLADEVAEGVLQAIAHYKLGIPALPPGGSRELALRWRIEGNDGVIGEETTNLNEELVATIDAPDGNYAVNVEVVDGDFEIPRGGVAVAVFRPTPTPTPEPTAEPTATHAPTQVAAAPQAEQQQQVAAAPVANSAGQIVGGGFEYGGHVTSAATAASGRMRQAGMNWMKVQLRYHAGMGPDVASGPIGAAHGQGFKILLGIVGEPNELAGGGGDYINQYANFLAGVARLGPDAIEVWNEPNIDREWPTGQISGEAYVNILRPAYQAIKGANSGVMVISGAPAPTGAEAAFPGRVMNDNTFVGQMVAAGGLQFMDCLGAHYNEGIVSPTQRSGDPRDGYYTRYYWGMVDTYWSLSGGQKPLCFTELGFLTSEGYGGLPGSFAWAQNVSLAQHAAWLAEAAALSSQSGKVRLMIVWNVDFSNYGADPMAGYAMIRADGSCPACDAMAGAR
jgi:hypothetical protein